MVPSGWTPGRGNVADVGTGGRRGSLRAHILVTSQEVLWCMLERCGVHPTRTPMEEQQVLTVMQKFHQDEATYEASNVHYKVGVLLGMSAAPEQQPHSGGPCPQQQ
ncbi:hypothetical protein Vretimale_3464, partial [Volvox reticuliferus]